MGLKSSLRMSNNKKHIRNDQRVMFFGHFGMDNFGNESTLQAMLYRLRLVSPNAEISCICTAPERVANDYSINAMPISYVVFKPWPFNNLFVKLVRKMTVGIVSEC